MIDSAKLRLMRWLAAGVILLSISASVFAQQGEVEGIGFNNQFRNDCWTPMVVRIKPGTTPAGTYQIQVTQNDLDRDHVIFTRTITLNTEDQSNEQRFWMYFIPQATDEGLPDSMRGLSELNRSLKVYLCNDKGKPIAPLPITTTVTNVDPFRSAFDQHRGTKLILCVSDGNSAPAWKDYDNSIGLMEDVNFVSIQPRNLPENILGYEAVDAIVWMNADPAELDRGGQHKLDVLKQWVRQGGKLVISQPAEWQKTLGFKDLLPVSLQGVHDKPDLSPLREMARRPDEPSVRESWNRLQGPFKFALATADKNAVVSEWIDWGDLVKPSKSPFIVRAGYGLGSVTWVAADLGNPAITLKTSGWPYVWDKVFDWKNDTLVTTNRTSDSEKRPYLPARGVDVGASFISRMDLDSRTSWLMSLAVVFFIVYWLVAGPGSYLFLAQKKKARLSWFIFGASAVVATLITVVLVRVILRGDPEIRHISLVRAVPGEPAVVYSRFGLYIPRDGEQTIELQEASPESVSTLTAFPIHPQYLKSNSRFSANLDYIVNVRDAADTQAASITVPYRSTLKKLQARWVGPMEKRIDGSAKLLTQGKGRWIEGKLINGTDFDFINVYIVFNYPFTSGDDWVLAIPGWKKGETIDLNQAFNNGFLKTFDELRAGRVMANTIGRAGKPSEIDRGWVTSFRGANLDENFDDSKSGFSRSFPVASLYERLWPMANSSGQTDRVELLRRSVQKFDISQAVAAGNMVILAQSNSDSPLPFPLLVNGTKVAGTGTTFFQFVLPLDRSGMDK